MHLRWWRCQHLSGYVVACSHLTEVGMTGRFVRFSLKVIVQNDRDFVVVILL